MQKTLIKGWGGDGVEAYLVCQSGVAALEMGPSIEDSDGRDRKKPCSSLVTSGWRAQVWGR